MSLRPAIPLYHHRGHALVTGPAQEPVSVSELCAHLELDASAARNQSDAADLIADARTLVEEYTGLALINQSWRLTLDNWPAGREAWWDGVRQMAAQELYTMAQSSLSLPRYPLVSITSCTVYDEASNAAAVTVASVFDVDAYSKPGRLTLRRGAVWPVALRASNAIEIVYLAGHGEQASSVPGPLKRAVKNLAAYMHAKRGDSCSADDMMTKSGAAMLLNAHRVARI
jgi:uncharacterized phiE125 gp8 family phage protein